MITIPDSFMVMLGMVYDWFTNIYGDFMTSWCWFIAPWLTSTATTKKTLGISHESNDHIINLLGNHIANHDQPYHTRFCPQGKSAFPLIRLKKMEVWCVFLPCNHSGINFQAENSDQIWSCPNREWGEPVLAHALYASGWMAHYGQIDIDMGVSTNGIPQNDWFYDGWNPIVRNGWWLEVPLF